MWWLLLPLARAEAPLPSYRDELVDEAWDKVDDQLEHGEHERAEKIAVAFETTVCEDGSIEYLIGLSYRLRQQNDTAKLHYQRALDLDPEQQAAWNDLGELWIAEGKWDEAEKAFEEVSRLVPSGEHGWIGPWRLAEIAANRHDPKRFEDQIRVALARGFSFRLVMGLENWKRFYADPAMHATVEKMITVYATPDVLDSLRP
jgi:tetratricopeptide (TPR) repeat protein